METTENAFLGGRLRVRQPASGYRAGADPVFLAASVNAQAGEHVLDVGCGAGVATLCLLARSPHAFVTGIEKQKDLVDLARSNADLNGFQANIIHADIRDLPSGLKESAFDHVMTNPPFFDRRTGSRAADAGREQGRGASLNQSQWLTFCLKRLRSGGGLHVVNRIENLPACMTALQDNAGEMIVQPFAAREGRAAKLFILTAKKGAKGRFRLNPPFVLHQGAHHEHDGESYTEAAQNILRKGASLPLEH